MVTGNHVLFQPHQAFSLLLGVCPLGVPSHQTVSAPRPGGISTSGRHQRGGGLSVGTPWALVMAPTRELVLQIALEMGRFERAVGAKGVAVYGGAPKGAPVNRNYSLSLS
jgi:hypothetical protein